MVNAIFARWETERPLSAWELLRYGSAKSEEDQSINGAKSGLEYSQKALTTIEAQLAASDVSSDISETAFHCRSNISGLYFWLWNLDPNDQYLDRAIETLTAALADADRAMKSPRKFAIGRFAQGHMKLLFMLRMQEKDRNRPDKEGHRDSALSAAAEVASHLREASYLRWYQAMVWADMGDRRRSQALAISAIAEDARIRDLPGCAEIGRRQYSSLRRFLEQYSAWSPNSDCFGDISQHLQIGQVDVG